MTKPIHFYPDLFKPIQAYSIHSGTPPGLSGGRGMLLVQSTMRSADPSPPSTLSISSQPAGVPPVSGRISRKQQPDQRGGRQNPCENGKFDPEIFQTEFCSKYFYDVWESLSASELLESDALVSLQKRFSPSGIIETIPRHH